MLEHPSSREKLFPEILILKVPKGTNEAIRQAARPKHMTNSAYVRQLIHVDLGDAQRFSGPEKVHQT